MTTTSYVTSRDGTRIAMEHHGAAGPPLVLVGGILCDRRTTRPLAEQLAAHAAVTAYDRRGRGDSGETPPYAVEREVEDLAALIAEVGGEASVYGHSSGAGLALHAAAAGLPIRRLVLHEPPYGPDDEDSVRSARELAEHVRDAVDRDRPGEAIRLFLADSGMPPEMIEEMSREPRMRSLARTMAHDHEVMGDFSRGGTIPEDLVRAVAVPTMVISGGASEPFFQQTAARIAALLPDGTSAVLDGHDHAAPPEVVAPVVAGFVTA